MRSSAGALSFVTSFTQVIVICGLFFAGSNILAGPIAATVLLTRWFDRRRGTALGIAISGIAAGTVIFPLVIQALFDAFAWRDGLRALALILFLCCAPALMLLVNRPEERGLHADGADQPRRPAFSRSSAARRSRPKDRPARSAIANTGVVPSLQASSHSIAITASSAERPPVVG